MIRRHVAGVALAGLALAGSALGACSDDGDDDGATSATAGDGGSAVIVTTSTPPRESVGGSTPDSTGPTGTAAPPATTAPPTEPPPMGDPQVDFAQIARLDQPVDLAWRANDSALYVVEQPGRVTAIDATGATRAVLDVTDLTNAAGERGLLGLAFAPAGDLAYINYTDGSGDTVIAEMAVEVDGSVDRDTFRVVLTIDQPYPNHNGGDLEFGPDGMLYIGMGDGGSGGDPERRALDVTTLLGKLLRIDPRASGDQPYSVPPDNPFIGVDGARPEVFAIGLRNPWKFTFDLLTTDLWIADVGQNRMEEVNHVAAPADGSIAGRGASFGWSAYEGTDRFNDDQTADGHVAPVLTYVHGDDGCSISGGAPYHGAAIPALSSGYVYGDYCSGRVWALDLAGGRNVMLADLDASVTAVVAGPDGELYVLDAGGPVLRIVPVS